MLRPATLAQLERLRAAARQRDVDLDQALYDLGVLPPVDLNEIRSCLTPDCQLTAHTTRYGHPVIEVRVSGTVSAWIHQDGSVVLEDIRLQDA